MFSVVRLLIFRINIATPNVIHSDPLFTLLTRKFLVSVTVGKGRGAHQPPFTFHSHVFYPSSLFNQNYPLSCLGEDSANSSCTNTMHSLNDTNLHTQVTYKLVFFKT